MLCTYLFFFFSSRCRTSSDWTSRTRRQSITCRVWLMRAWALCLLLWWSRYTSLLRYVNTTHIYTFLETTAPMTVIRLCRMICAPLPVQNIISHKTITEIGKKSRIFKNIWNSDKEIQLAISLFHSKKVTFFFLHFTFKIRLYWSDTGGITRGQVIGRTHRDKQPWSHSLLQEI